MSGKVTMNSKLSWNRKHNPNLRHPQVSESVLWRLYKTKEQFLHWLQHTWLKGLLHRKILFTHLSCFRRLIKGTEMIRLTQKHSTREPLRRLWTAGWLRTSFRSSLLTTELDRQVACSLRLKPVVFPLQAPNLNLPAQTIPFLATTRSFKQLAWYHLRVYHGPKLAITETELKS